MASEEGTGKENRCRRNVNARLMGGVTKLDRITNERVRRREREISKKVEEIKIKIVWACDAKRGTSCS